MAVSWEVEGFLLVIAGEGQGFCSTGCTMGRDRVAAMVGVPVPCPALRTVTIPHQGGWPFPQATEGDGVPALLIPHPACKAQMW